MKRSTASHEQAGLCFDIVVHDFMAAFVRSLVVHNIFPFSERYQSIDMFTITRAVGGN